MGVEHLDVLPKACEPVSPHPTLVRLHASEQRDHEQFQLSSRSTALGRTSDV